MQAVRFLPSDINAIAAYLGVPLNRFPALAALCKIVYFEKLPAGWDEIEPRKRKNMVLPEGVHPSSNGLVYWHRASGKLTMRHPHDSFYNLMVQLIEKTGECPFVPHVLRFCVTEQAKSDEGEDGRPRPGQRGGGDEEEEEGGSPRHTRSGELRRTAFYYDFSAREVLPEEPAARVPGAAYLPGDVADDGDTKGVVTAFTVKVQCFASDMIKTAWRQKRMRKRMHKTLRLSYISRSIHARRIQIAWRRGRRRMLLREWDKRRVARQHFKHWWKRLANSKDYAFRLRVARARRRIGESEGGKHSVRLGKIELSPEERRCFDVLNARVVQLEDRLAGRDAWESRRGAREAAEEAEEAEMERIFQEEMQEES